MCILPLVLAIFMFAIVLFIAKSNDWEFKTVFLFNSWNNRPLVILTWIFLIIGILCLLIAFNVIHFIRISP